jgi:hypothetical protein
VLACELSGFLLLLDKAGGEVAVRRTRATTICRVDYRTQVSRPKPVRDASTVTRFRRAHQSMINRHDDGRASCLARQSLNQPLPPEPEIFTRLLLGKADIRVAFRPAPRRPCPFLSPQQSVELKPRLTDLDLSFGSID